MKILTVKEQTCNVKLTGYWVNGNTFFPVENCELIKQWLSEGNIPESEFTDAEREAQRIQLIKAKASELITSKYPDYKQLNIIRIGGAELEVMSAYIDSIREISNKAEQDGTKLEDIQWQ